MKHFDDVVVGGGHAGCEALHAACRYGLNAALNGQQGGKRTVEIHYRNDSYEPSKTVPAVQKLIRQQQG